MMNLENGIHLNIKTYFNDSSCNMNTDVNVLSNIWANFELLLCINYITKYL